ncbi:thiosulfate/3-mercaptopyruvate sulfurtransferase [Thiothrix eikelboomii]|uniref:Thiosulfate/3-mercaptopyruvate sulfurtransferase n=1 Tax=Thiothrix eikelboomii TaxID=92487 RepID=A0A1T4WB47_9GAMM|nr:sulfurtransferase [Thiothrix eikelboomii]SKA74503.1 thiosulfate/3-mercaptopyruvate sulfurtransferase [Thiothrix eikelboomii]
MYNTLINTQTLVARLGQKDQIIFDCRFNLADPEAGKRAYQAGHIPGAFYLHLDHDLSSPMTPTTGRHPLPDPQQLATKLAAYGLNEHTQVFVYDDISGAFAARTWWLLRWLGHQAIAVLDGGLPAWLEQGGRLEQHPPSQPEFSGNFKLKLHPDYVLTTAQLSQAHHYQLIDARSAERFRGELEPIDPIAGHIPGAKNRPLTDNLSQGRFKTAEQLQQEWSVQLAGLPPEQIVHLCGSGVSACHNVLAMEIAGLSGSGLYVGSWSEWIRDPKRPIARGAD